MGKPLSCDIGGKYIHNKRWKKLKTKHLFYFYKITLMKGSRKRHENLY